MQEGTVPSVGGGSAGHQTKESVQTKKKRRAGYACVRRIASSSPLYFVSLFKVKKDRKRKTQTDGANGEKKKKKKDSRLKGNGIKFYWHSQCEFPRLVG